MHTIAARTFQLFTSIEIWKRVQCEIIRSDGIRATCHELLFEKLRWNFLLRHTTVWIMIGIRISFLRCFCKYVLIGIVDSAICSLRLQFITRANRHQPSSDAFLGTVNNISHLFACFLSLTLSPSRTQPQHSSHWAWNNRIYGNCGFSFGFY